MRTFDILKVEHKSMIHILYELKEADYGGKFGDGNKIYTARMMDMLKYNKYNNLPYMRLWHDNDLEFIGTLDYKWLQAYADACQNQHFMNCAFGFFPVPKNKVKIIETIPVTVQKNDTDDFYKVILKMRELVEKEYPEN